MTTVLLSAEDPGAANFLAPVAVALKKSSLSVAVVAAGKATEIFERRSVAYLPAEDTPVGVLLDRFEPAVVLAGTADKGTLGIRLIAECRSRGIASVGAVDARLGVDHRFSGPLGNPLEFVPDWIVVPDAYTRNEYLKLGCRAERVIEVGQPHLEYVRSLAPELEREGHCTVRRRIFPGAPENARIVIFIDEPRLSGAQGQIDTATYTLRGSGRSTWRTQIVLDEFLDVSTGLDPRPHLVLRIHPRSQKSDYADHLDRFDEISRGGDALEAVFSADLAVGMTSMLLAEAAALGVPTLSIVPTREESKYLLASAAEVTPIVATREEIRAVLPKLLVRSAHRTKAERGSAEASSRILEVLETAVETNTRYSKA